MVSFYFMKRRPLLFFSLDNKCFATTPLVMSQSLKSVATELLDPIDGADQYILLVRPEEGRLLSAFNKKVLAAKFNIKKRGLLAASGLSFGMSFDEFLQTLIMRRKQGKFIDRHFVPQEVLHLSIPMENLWEKYDITKPGQPLLSGLPRLKTTNSILGMAAAKKNLAPSESLKIQQYLELWR